ncbi:hypothetical protein HPB47_009291, partial [Ixodes persulcatus]
ERARRKAHLCSRLVRITNGSRASLSIPSNPGVDPLSVREERFPRPVYAAVPEKKPYSTSNRQDFVEARITRTAVPRWLAATSEVTEGP